VLKELIHRSFTNKECIGFLLNLGIFLLAWKEVGSFLCGFLMFIFPSRNINFNKILKANIIVCSLGLILTVLSSKVGIIPNYLDSDLFGRTRFYLGFRYALYAPAVFFNVLASYLYLKRKEVTLFELVSLLVLSYYFYYETQSRLSFVMSIILIFLSFVLKNEIFYKTLKKSWVSLGFCFSYVFCTIFSLIASEKYSPNSLLMYDLNKLLENRLYYSKQSLDQFGINAFSSGAANYWQGNGLDKSGGIPIINKYYYVDNFYIHLMQQYGFLIAILLIILITLSLLKCYRRSDIYMILIFTIFAFHGLLDNLMFTLYYNIFLLLPGILFYQKSEEKLKLFKSINYNYQENFKNITKENKI
jgi:hypothetical protein